MDTLEKMTNKSEVSFDRDKFLNSCLCGCTKDRQIILDSIEEYRDSKPKLSRQLEYYRDHLWRIQIREDEYRQMRVDLGDDALNKKTADALRAMADKVEQQGPHFMIFCSLPAVPIFSDGEFCSSVEVIMLACPVGG
jgi:hypothetical protein